MRIWLALIVAPLLALESQSIAFALVHWACDRQTVAAVHALYGACIGATVAFTALAWRHRQESAAVGGGEARRRHRFLSGLATASAALSSLVIAAMWVPTWMLSPCIT
jgi:hypothetical protein